MFGCRFAAFKAAARERNRHSISHLSCCVSTGREWKFCRWKLRGDREIKLRDRNDVSYLEIASKVCINRWDWRYASVVLHGQGGEKESQYKIAHNCQV
jgi:hypothetical protein